jgi:hypothetical protein
VSASGPGHRAGRGDRAQSEACGGGADQRLGIVCPEDDAATAAGAGTPPGRLHHTCYGDNRALRVSDVFDTRQNFEAFGRTLFPILATVGVDIGQPEIVEVHNIVRG